MLIVSLFKCCVVLKNATHKAKTLRLIAQNALARRNVPFGDSVIAVIPFATVGQVEGGHAMVPQIRTAFFEQSFWSIYRYFPNIVISVTRKRDLDFLKTLHLPLFDIFISTVNDDPKGGYAHNVKQALLLAHENLLSNASWSSFKFLYYSEGDLVLHMRKQEQLLNLMASSTANKEDFFLAPHRMQVRV
jgi:hypothetical protein